MVAMDDERGSPVLVLVMIIAVILCPLFAVTFHSVGVNSVKPQLQEAEQRVAQVELQLTVEQAYTDKLWEIIKGQQQVITDITGVLFPEGTYAKPEVKNGIPSPY